MAEESSYNRCILLHRTDIQASNRSLLLQDRKWKRIIDKNLHNLIDNENKQ